jgi:hypothetical protein
MRVDEYLAELALRLPRTRRRRFLMEAEDHLRDAASANRRRGLDADAAEQAAVESFGDPEVVARRFATVTALSSVRRASLLALAAVVVLVLPLYGIPENTLPPARWDAKPTDIAVLQSVAIALWLTAIVLAALGLGFSLARQTRLAAGTLVAATTAVAGFLAVGVVLFARWLGEAPWTPLWPFLGLALPISVGCLGICVAASISVRDRSRTLRDALGHD